MKFNFNTRQPIIERKVQLLTIARLVEKKGVQYSIKAVANILKKFPNIEIEYKIIGDGPLRKDLENLISELGIADHVKLLGWKPQEEIIKVLAEADVFMAPSVTSLDGDQEGIPVVLMEALAQGLPVISTYHSGIPELVQDKKTGFLAKERDVDSIVEKLEYLLLNKASWPQIRKAGRTHVIENYEIQKLNDQLVALYHKLINDDFEESLPSVV